MDLQSIPIKIKQYPYERLLEYLLALFSNMYAQFNKVRKDIDRNTSKRSRANRKDLKSYCWELLHL
jgi:hypothetical protein